MSLNTHDILAMLLGITFFIIGIYFQIQIRKNSKEQAEK